MTVLLFLLAAFWQAVLTAAGPVQSASDRQNRELAVVALGSLAVRAAIPDSAESLSEPVTASFAVPMFASFLPIISYSTLVFVVAFVAAQFRKWFKLRRRGPHHLEEDDESNVELLPTSTANVLPEFRDFAVPLPNVFSPPPSRMGRPIESRVERLKSGSGRVHGRSVSLSHPSAVSQATLLPDPFPSSPHHFHSTPNTPSPLIDLSIPDGIHTRKPFVNELTSDINISSDTLFGVHRSLSNRSQDIADIYLKMRSIAPEPVPSSPTESHSSEQDITLVQTETDLIDFSPKQRALQLEETRLISDESKLVDSPVEDTAAVVELVVEQEDKKPAEPEMQLLDFSQWDEEGWGFEVVTPSVANEELDHSDDDDPVVYPLDAATGSPWETKELDSQPTLEDPFASPPADHAVLEPVESGSTEENVIEASPSGEGVENPFASPVGRRASLEEDATPPAELLSSSSGSSDTLEAVESVTVPAAAVEHDDSSYDSSTDSSPSQIQPVVADYERLETPSPQPLLKDDLLPIQSENDSSEELLVSAAHPSGYDSDSESISAPSSPSVDVAATPPLLDVLRGVVMDSDCDVHETEESLEVDPDPLAIAEHSALPSPALEETPLPIANESNENTHDDNDSDEPLDDPIPDISISIPDPDFLPLVASPKKELSAQTPTPPESPLLTPVRKVKPAWSLRAADAPALGLSASASAASSPAEAQRTKEKETKTPVSPPSPSQSPLTLSTALPGSFPAAEPTPATAPVASSSTAVEKKQARPRVTRSPIDIALAMQLRPGLGIGADPAWMVRFLMSMFGWMVVLISGSSGSEGYHYPVRR